MSEPHEEEWFQSVAGTVRVHAPGTGSHGALVAQVATAPREAIIIAAPDMARAILKALRSDRYLPLDVLDEMRAALTKAGVPPP